MIIDASVILRAFFRDEVQPGAQALIRHHVSGQSELAAPTLLEYEVTNAVVQAVRRGRITAKVGEELLTAIEGLDITLAGVTWQQMVRMARRLDRSAHNAAHLALAETRGERLVTGDRRLYDAVHPHLDWVQWIGDSQRGRVEALADEWREAGEEVWPEGVDAGEQDE